MTEPNIRDYSDIYRLGRQDEIDSIVKIIELAPSFIYGDKELCGLTKQGLIDIIKRGKRTND